MENEITVRVKCGMKEICNLLEYKKFKVSEKYSMNDTYFIHKGLDIKSMSYREILSTAILLREITEIIPKKQEVIKLTFKDKQIDFNGDILNQTKIDCEILSAEAGKAFIKAIGYKELMSIEECDIVYEKEGLKIAIKDVKNEELLIEIEIVEGNNQYDTIDKLKQEIKELKLPIDESNYFVKKAEIKLAKIL